VTGAATYNVYRGTTSGGETLLASGITLPASLSKPIYYDLGALNGTTYYYEVTAVAGGVESVPSAETAAVLPSFAGYTAIAYQLSTSATTAVSGYAGDSGFAFLTGGVPFDNVSYNNYGTITTPNMNAPGPVAVYRWERYSTTSSWYYALGGLRAGATYLLRLHEGETYFGAASTCTSNNCSGIRVFNVTINGTQVLTSFDPFAAAGGPNMVVGRVFSATANGAGVIYVGFCSQSSVTSPTTCTPPANGSNFAKVDAIQVFSTPPNVLLTLTASASTARPGDEITYSTAFVNTGASPSYGTVIVTPIPSAACYNVTSLTSSLPTGVSANVTYSIDNGGHFAYTPQNGACGSAATGYDSKVTNVKWTLSGMLSATDGNNSGSVGFSARVR
jgi:beta-galactosidase